MLAVVFDDRNSERIETYLFFFFLTLAFWWKTFASLSSEWVQLVFCDTFPTEKILF